MIAPPRYIVFAGTGVLNAAYAGALEELERQQLLGAVEAFCGTSSGSIVATLAAVGYSPSEITQAIFDLDFTKILDGSLIGGPMRLVRGYGWHPAAYLVDQLESLIAARLGNGRATFADMQAAGCKGLRIVGANVSARTARIFPDAGSLGMPVADAVRISMSIPFMFVAQRVDGDVYVDGGVLANYAVQAFDAPGQPPASTLGFHVGQAQTPRTNIRSLHDFVASLFACILTSQEAGLLDRPVDLGRTVFIEPGGVSAIDFDITREQKAALVEAGATATRAFLSRQSGTEVGPLASPAR